jgi:hypothetical protein
MEGASRTRLVALAVLLAVSVPLIVIAAAGGGSDDTDTRGSGLRIEPSPEGLPILVIYLEDADVNKPDTNHGERTVAIECLDDSDEVVFTGEKGWPFRDTDGGLYNPHVHMVVRPAAAIEQIVRCRLRGTDPPLEGRKA